jgi:hypothetical protein
VRRWHDTGCGCWCVRVCCAPRPPVGAGAGRYCWFEEQLGRRLLDLFDENPLFATNKAAAVLDVGCGNGMFLRDLHDLG